MLTQKICPMCDKIFEGGPSAIYCNDFVKTAPKQYYCSDCKNVAVKEIDRKQGLEYYHKNKIEINFKKAKKRKEDKK